MLGVMFFERDPLQFSDIPALVLRWLLAVSPFALFGMFLLVGVRAILVWGGQFQFLRRYAIFRTGALYDSPKNLFLPFPWMRKAVWICFGISIVATIGQFLFFRGQLSASLSGIAGSRSFDFYTRAYLISGLVAGAAGVVGIGIPFIYGCLPLSWRRIWALTRLSFAEGVRRRVLYVFSVLLIVLMFASWFLSSKPEDQVRTYVQVIDLAMTPLLLFAGVLVAAFSIPTDIRQQTIHTILTKPVERFEIALGRFFGYVGLMTVVLVVLSLVGVLYVLRGIDPDAAAESLKARDPWYGTLLFENTKDPRQADSVGREWDYRSYISGPLAGVEVPATAVWRFTEPSSSLGARQKVLCEFAFDIYRTTKGYENRGVNCSFVFTTWKFKKETENAAKKKRRALLDENKSENEADNAVAEEFGIFEIPAKQISDYHTLSIDLPGGLFKNAIPVDAAERRAMTEAGKSGVAPIMVRVACLSPTQYVGMARYDLYVRQDSIENSADRFWFAVNFFKGAFGLWLRLCLVIGLAVCLSTYLTGVISLLIALLLYVGGVFREFIQQVALGTNEGGGPLESLVRLTSRATVAGQLEQTTTTTVAKVGDYGFQGLVHRILDMIPDIRYFDMTRYVAEGFNIPLGSLGLNFLLLVGYLLPWFVVAYFAMKAREIASAS
jgi:ABC-type transport system involved in multi-copper enzyme maturation permease subunit